MQNIHHDVVYDNKAGDILGVGRETTLCTEKKVIFWQKVSYFWSLNPLT